MQILHRNEIDGYVCRHSKTRFALRLQPLQVRAEPKWLDASSNFDGELQVRRTPGPLHFGPEGPRNDHRHLCICHSLILGQGHLDEVAF